MKKNVLSDTVVAVIEPVGSHGGMDYYDSGLCAGLLENGIDSIWYTCDISEQRGSYPVKIVRTFKNIWGKDPAWKRGVFFVFGLFSTLTDALKRKVRIAHFHFFHIGVLELLCVFFARLSGLRVVATIHDVESFKKGGKSMLLQHWVYALCSRLIVHNQVSFDEFKERLNISDRLIRIIPHGSYLGLIPEVMARKKARDIFGIGDNEKVILFFGQIKEVKGLDLLLSALPKVRDRIGSVKLVIAGKVWKDDFSRYQEIIDSQGLADLISLHVRYILDEEIASFYGLADVVVLPYRKIYQSGVLLMAMSYGIPVLASDLRGMSEIITDGRNGFLFHAGDKNDLAERLAEILTKERKQIFQVVEAAKYDMESRFSWKTIGEQTKSVYTEIVD